MGGFLCLGLVLVGIAGTVVLSLISLYTANHGEAGYGEEYRLDAMMLKFLYTNISGNFSGGSIVGNTDLSNLACTQLTNKGYKSVYGCILENGLAYGPYSSSPNARRRRRRDVTVGGYSVHDGRLFFSNRCPKTSDLNATQYSSSVSSCVKQRLAFCNSLVNDDITTSSFVEWLPTPSLTLSIYDAYLSTYQSLSPSHIYGIPRSSAATIASTLNLNSYTQTELNSGCRYAGPLPMSTINSIIAAQSSLTTTTPATTAVAGG
jgi:hypothetical protein